MTLATYRSLLHAIAQALDTSPTAFAFVDAGGRIGSANSAARKLLFDPEHEPSLPLGVPVDLEPNGRNPARCRLTNGNNIELEATAVSENLAIVVLRAAEAQGLAASDPAHLANDYESLFQNAVCGVYRDRLDGTPVRANRVLSQFNGYSSEEEHLHAVKTHGGSWYVDSGRAKYFQHLMETHGCVRDLVSEVYRHRTKEKAWITENAWYIRDETGQPIFIEGTIQDATERVEAMAETERQASTDPLTGLTNRFRFMKALHEAVPPEGRSIGLLTIDLDKFKEVNDLFGHSAGDMVLRTAARRLVKATTGLEAIIARLGGDEFAVLVYNHDSAVELRALAAEIVDAMQRPIDIEGHDAVIGASVGVVHYSQEIGGPKDFLNSADLALYEVKKTGRNNYCVFDPAMKTMHQRRRELEAELRDAIRQDALELFYQPIVRAADTTIVGFEALMRWNHPKRGQLPPSEFIPLAEESGLMTDLGSWAIERACEQAAQLPPDIQVSVNVSPSHLRSTSILEVVRAALSKSALSPSRLILEVTETALISSESIASRTLSGLLDLGVELALDDFGTGYSSLSYLQRYTFSEIKIDRSFVSGIQNTAVNLAIIRAVIALASELDIKVVAEGIETALQADFLRVERCGFLQGYFFGKPKAFNEIVADLAVQRLKRAGLAPASNIGSQHARRSVMTL